jgi:hypothetical protein
LEKLHLFSMLDQSYAKEILIKLLQDLREKAFHKINLRYQIILGL